jgi:hypothetical protein
MDMDLREALGQGFGPEPPHRPVHDRLEGGHRAVRRRRIATAIVTVAVAGVVGVGAVAVLGEGADAPSQVATDPASGWDPGVLARYTADGEVEVRPGVTVLQRIDAPLPAPGGAEHRSVALAVEADGAEHWLLLEWDGPGFSATSAFHPDGAFATLQDWVGNQVALQTDPADRGNAEYISFADDGSLVTTHGVRVLDQRHPVDLENFVARGTDRTASALLQGPDGKKWYVLVREVYDEIDTQVVPFRVGGPDLEAFLRFAAQAFASGEGLR